ncbi:hypothetical protein [Allohahella marinimesophila]|uniref:AbrB/MazE/SpoVT family DNA-binding domain-containing protein n=1 Tax=Allohahella marinimesophila TaxID=1054972 RepID=A0ABP7NT41_9GAMM
MKELEISIDENWQILLPEEVSEALGLQSGGCVVWSINDQGEVQLRKSVDDAAHKQHAE